MEKTTLLYRPVGANELALIAASGYSAFPPRRPGQPIFYPVLNQEYATQIARDWNATKVPLVSRVCHAFRRKDKLSFTVHRRESGRALALEYWIPAETLHEFNQNIVGKIEVISEFHGK